MHVTYESQGAGPAGGEGVFDRIDHQFGDDEADADRLVRSDHAVVGDHLEHDRLILADHGGGQAGAKRGQIGPDLDLIDAAHGVQVGLDRGDRHDALMGVLQMVAGFLGGHDPGLQHQDAGDDLQAVGDAVLHFLEQDPVPAQQVLGLLEQLLLFHLDRPARRDVGEGEQDRRVRAGVVEHLARVQQHDPAAEPRKIMVDFEAVHGGVLGDDGLHQHAQRRDIPLPVAQAVEQGADGLFGVDCEGLVERAAGGQHPELGVQNDEGLVDGVHDRLGERLGVFDPLEEVFHRRKHKSDPSARARGMG